MRLIDGQIPRQSYELIRDRICQILVEEMEWQYVLAGSYSPPTIWMDRFEPFDFTELPSINVGLERGDPESYHQGQTDWTYRYFMEINTSGVYETELSLRGDTEAKKEAHKIMGIVHGILDNPIYKTLGFPLGQLIKHRHLGEFVFAEPTRQDAHSVTMARAILVVKAVQTTDLIEANLIAGWDTHVKLHETEKGYYWSKEE